MSPLLQVCLNKQKHYIKRNEQKQPIYYLNFLSKYGQIYFWQQSFFLIQQDFYVRKQVDPLVAMPLAMSVICPSRSSVAFFAPLGRPLLCRVQMVREFKLPGRLQQAPSKTRARPQQDPKSPQKPSESPQEVLRKP